LGLAIFVYTIGLSSAPAFFASFRRHGFSDLYFATFTVLVVRCVGLLFGANGFPSMRP
jgi:putative transport protein